jgi:uncharacterized damage-inducible protein DinB
VSRALVGHFERLLGFEREATARALASLGTVPAAQQAGEHARRARGILAHAQLARHEWLSRLGVIERRAWEQFPDWPAERLKEDADRLDGAWGAYLSRLTDADLEQRIEYRSLDGSAWRSRVGDVIAHVLNHSTYHRGQVAMLVKQAGGTPASTDVIVLSRERG